MKNVKVDIGKNTNKSNKLEQVKLNKDKWVLCTNEAPNLNYYFIEMYWNMQHKGVTKTNNNVISKQK